MQLKNEPYPIPKSWQLIPNIFLDFPTYNCFVCSPFHEWGFKLKFYYDHGKNRVVSPVWAPEAMAGFPKILHGGFQSMLLDEIFFWTIYHFYNKLTVTGSLNVKFKKTVSTQTPFLVFGQIEKAKGPLFKVKGGLEKDNIILAQGEGVFVQPSFEDFKAMAQIKESPPQFLPLFDRLP